MKIRHSVVAVFCALAASSVHAGEDPPVLVGRVLSAQGQPVQGVHASFIAEEQAGAASAVSRSDGYFVIELPQHPVPGARLVMQRRHFETVEAWLSAEQLGRIAAGESVFVGTHEMPRRRSIAFWITLVVFAGMMLLIAVTPMHNALAAMVGASLILATSAVGAVWGDDLVVYGFSDAMRAIDWNVVFLIMGMMIVIAVVEGTGVFRWLAFFAYKTSGGSLWKLMTVLMVLTAVSSAVLDNVTTMLLMTPITIRIALALDTDPLTLLLPEIMAANVGGLSTMVGTPTNILIASYSGISFGAFFINLTPGVLLALVGVIVYSALRHRKQFAAAGASASDDLVERLRHQAVISQPGHLKKAGWVGLGMVAGFILGEHLHVPPAVIALVGATTLMVWIRPNVEEMIEAVDWTTLVFFITLFMVVGALAEVGVIDLIGHGIGAMVGDSWLLAMIAITWLAALFSTVIPNIPFTATMLPVVGYLTGTIPGGDEQSLYFCLAVGAAMGGNGSLIGASANLVAAGVSERAGYPISFGHFFRIGFPALLISVTLALGWLLLRYMVF